MKMRNFFLFGSCLLITLPTGSTSIKITPKIVSTPSYHRTVNEQSSRNVPPTAFINFGKTTAAEEPAPSPIPFAQQIIVLPIVMKLTATFLVPCTKKFYEFLSLAIENGVDGATKISKVVCAAINGKARKFPAQATKALNSFCQMCSSATKNTVGALIEFYDHVGKGFVDTVSGTKAWAESTRSFTYNKVLLPTATNSVNFINQIAEDLTAWLENSTLYTARYLSMMCQEFTHFVNNLAIDASDYAKHYYLMTEQQVIAFINGTIKTLTQTYLAIPLWLSAMSGAIIGTITSFATFTKQGIIDTYDELVSTVEKFIDDSPFFTKYEEDGEMRVSLSPNAQMVLYLFSVVFAAQPIWEENPLER